MTRAVARSLVLVNWRGVFYERYELDRRVTALEGANGAGKTTVMIAAYLTLLPDLNRLRFTNLGESGATGGDRGIYGRLGQQGAPSYAALELETPGGERVVAGVQLVRKSEPIVELATFVITDLHEEIRLKDVFLLQNGPTAQVPEMSELKELVARAAGRLKEHGSAKDYLAALYDHGVTPLRLATDEERTKLNEMLRTSMTGGISRTLTNDLRSFLLRQEPGLGDTLSNMRANLEACRRTRTEVQSSQALQAEILGVYEAGEEMFAAAFHATRERADEMRRAAERAREAHATAELELEEKKAALEAASGAARTVEDRLADAHAHALAAAQHHRDVLRAHGLARTLRAREAASAEAARNEAVRVGERDRAADHRARARAEEEQANDSWARAARGLADAQAGIDELHRRADAHRRVTREMSRARTILGSDVEDIDEAHARVVLERTDLDAEAPRLSRELATAVGRSAEHGRASAALKDLAGEEVEPLERHAHARRELARMAELGVLARRAPALAAELEAAQARTALQARTRAAAASLGIAPSAAAVHGAMEAAAAERAEHDRRRAEKELEAGQASRLFDDTRARIVELQRRAAVWGEVARLVEEVGEPVHSAPDLERLDASCQATRDWLVPAGALLEEQRDAALRAASDLERLKGAFPPGLARVRDEVGGELLASRFDDLDPEEAGPYQALLGPLAEAIVVDDPAAAGQRIAGRPRDVESVVLIGAGGLVDTGPLEARRGGDIVVAEDGRVRVSRIPDQPTLGLRARAARIDALREDARRIEEQRLQTCASLLAVERKARAVAELRMRLDVLTAGDPSREIESARKSAAAAERQAAESRAEATEARQRVADLDERARAIRELLPDARLLDPPDQAVALAGIEAEHQAALAAAREVERAGPSARIVAELLDALRVPPPTEEELETLKVRLGQVARRRDALFHAAEALEHVQSHRVALGWSDAEERLGLERRLVPDLAAAEASAKEAVHRARANAAAMEEAWQAAVTAAQEAHAASLEAAGRARLARSELESIGVGEPSDEDLARAGEAAEKAEAIRARVQSERNSVAATLTRREMEKDAAAAEEERTRDVHAAALSDARPHVERWERLEARAREQKLLDRANAPRFVELFTGLGTPNLSTRAKTAGTRVVERLRSAQRAQDVLRSAEAWIGADDDRSEGYLTLWLEVRDWLRRRLPAHIAEVDDPLLALSRLKDELANLEERLRGQEAVLRGASEDVASHIEVQIRKALGTVQRLTRHLEGVSFGSIARIQVRLSRLETMSRLLDALRRPEAQQLLFDPGLPIEEALDLLFQRHGGAGAAGQKLLDYREYIALHAEVKRRASADWEAANATRLSTGEAIGVGAAIMMVVLAEWERDANLIRGRKSHGSLRFLFLDEANRLDRGNLDELFDLCANLDLQLLIAAPEVARAEGTTTYRLVREVENGVERVLVSGRRTRTS